MPSISSLKAANILRKKRIKFLTQGQAARLFGISNTNTSYKLLQRLEAKDILRRVTRGFYIVSHTQVNDFEVANAALKPSYVSLESALSHYGVLSQFPFTITSVTTKRSRRFTFNKEFEYTHIDTSLYWGFVKNQSFIIASPEKAILDIFYLQSKGLRKIDAKELDISIFDKNLLKEYCIRVNKPFVTKLLRAVQ